MRGLSEVRERREVVGLLSVSASLALGVVGNYLWFIDGRIAHEVFPLLLVGMCFAFAGMWRGQKTFGALALVLQLPAAVMSGFIILFFALGGSR